MGAVDMTFEAYRAHPAISTSTLLDCRRSPLFARDREWKDSDAMRLGRVMHCLALEPDEFASRYVVSDQCSAVLASGKKKGQRCSNPGKVYVSNDGEGAWYCGAHGRGLTPAALEVVSEDEMALCTGAVEGLNRHPCWPTFSATEVSYFGTFEGLDMKVRPDGIAGTQVWDLKRVAQPSRIRFSAMEMGWLIRAAIYLEITGGDEYVYGCVTASYPHEPWFYRVTDEQRAVGLEEARRLAGIWKECVATGFYPGGNEVIEDLPVQVIAPELDWSDVEVEDEYAS